MKASEIKTTSSNLYSSTQQESKPFFQKDGEGAFFSHKVPTVQRFFEPSTSPFIQTKLSIGQPGDKYEREADAMADKVVQHINSPTSAPAVQTKCTDCNQQEQIQKMEGEEEMENTNLGLQQKAIFESNEPPPDASLQRNSGSDAPQTASSNLESRLSATKGSGQFLPENTRSSMESAFGADFSGVRVHTNNESVQMNQELGAQAFTHGADVYFNRGKYSPDSTDGQRLLGHELTHVVQQGGSQVKAKRMIQLKPIREDYPWPGKTIKKAELKDKPAADDATKENLNMGERVTVYDDSSTFYKVLPEDGYTFYYTLQENIKDLPKLRTDFPWEGIVLNDITLYSKPWTWSTEVKDLKKDAHVTVKDTYLDYYEVSPKDEPTQGYTLQKNIDDPTSAKLDSLVGSTMKWDQSSATGKTDFAVAARDTSKSLPGVAPGTVINCWEAVLLAAFQIGVLSRDKIKDLYSNQTKLKGMMKKERGTYEIGKKKQVPQRGEIVYMNGLDHVVLAAGEMDATGNAVIYSFWPPSDFSPAIAKAKLAAGKIDELKTGKIQKTTIEALADWMINMGISPHPITFGAPSW